jgi:hypothetical protein
MHTAKKGLRILGIAESFSSREYSVLAGLVMRKDLRIDGAAFGRIRVGGLDATDGVLAIYRELGRQDINLIMTSGCVIAWYNIIDPAEVSRRTGCPVIVVTYEDSPGLEEDISRLFPGDSRRMNLYKSLGPRHPVHLATGYSLFMRCEGLPPSDAAVLIKELTYEGRVPEPLRVARLLARGVMRSWNGGISGHRTAAGRLPP